MAARNGRARFHPTGDVDGLSRLVSARHGGADREPEPRCCHPPTPDLSLEVEVDHLDKERAKSFMRAAWFWHRARRARRPFVPHFVAGIDPRFWRIRATTSTSPRLPASASLSSAPRLGDGQCRDRARSRRGQRRPFRAPAGSAAHQQIHRHRQPGRRAWLRRLSDDWKWKFLDYTLGARRRRRAARPCAFHATPMPFSFIDPVTSLEQKGDALVLSTPHGHYDIDFLILATAFASTPTNVRNYRRSRLHPLLERSLCAAEAWKIASSRNRRSRPGFEFQEKFPALPGSEPYPLLQLSGHPQSRQAFRRHTGHQRRWPAPRTRHSAKSLCRG